MALRRTFSARLIAAYALTPHMKELEFERLDGTPSTHAPGQWVDIVLPPKDEDGRIDRRYSYSSLADGTPRFRVLVTRIEGGAGSSWLHRAQPGVVLPMNGPDGTFVREQAQRVPTLFVAAGTGFAPVRLLIDDALRSEHPELMWVLLGARSLGDLPWASELERWKQLPTMRVELTLSQPQPGWAGRTGHVQKHLPELWRALTALHPDALVYVCGWRRMVFPVRDLLRSELGVDARRVRIEAFD
jgi:ferredoxin-NADP reductase